MNAIMQIPNRRLIFLVAGLLVLAALGFSFLHHHADGGDFDHCSVCKFVRQIVSFFIFSLVTFFSSVRPRYLVQEPVRLRSLSLSSKLRTRAPPFLS